MMRTRHDCEIDGFFVLVVLVRAGCRRSVSAKALRPDCSGRRTADSGCPCTDALAPLISARDFVEHFAFGADQLDLQVGIWPMAWVEQLRHGS